MLTQTITVNTTHSNVERLFGFDIYEDTVSAAAVVKLREGSGSGKVVKYLPLAIGESAFVVFDKPIYLAFPGGCYVKEVSGSVTGVLYH